MDIKKFLQSKTFKKILYGIGALVVLLLVFKAGEIVGFRKADFSYRWGENYYRAFRGPRQGFSADFGGRDFMMSHGTFGTIAEITSSTMVVKNNTEAEKVIVFTDSTAIRRFRDVASVGDLKVGDSVVVLGTPNASGQIVATLVRVMPEMPSLSSPPPFGYPTATSPK